MEPCCRKERLIDIFELGYDEDLAHNPIMLTSSGSQLPHGGLPHVGRLIPEFTSVDAVIFDIPPKVRSGHLMSHTR